MGKVVCIHGTESGGSERHAKRLSKSWPKANFDQSKDFMSGNDAASVGLEALAAKYDAFVIADEVYEDMVYEGEHVRIATLPGMAVVVLSSAPGRLALAPVLILSTSPKSTGCSLGALPALPGGNGKFRADVYPVAPGGSREVPAAGGSTSDSLSE